MDLLFSLFPNPESSFPLIAVILGLPLLGAFVNGVFGKRLGPGAVTLMALATVFGSFAASVVAFVMLSHATTPSTGHLKFLWTVWRWVTLDTTAIDVAFSIDSLSALMMLIVTGVGGLIHVYATEYMHGDPGYHRFFAYMNLFVFAMLVLVMGDSLPVLFVGWEGVGLCSYLLIGFWFEEAKNAAAAKKAFIANRIGDAGLVVAMAMILHSCGSLSWSAIESRAGELLTRVQIWPIGGGWGWIGSLNQPVFVSGATLVGLALFLGCAGKSAQIPLYVWLPDAMVGPTPVSALIHAATMVTAGVYLMARMNGVFVLSPVAMAVVATVGAVTALLAATIALAQNDIKKVLAYCTVSQLGFMFMAAGAGAFSAGIFHLFTHSFSKAALFLCAGSVIHAMRARIRETDGSQDMRNMGGLRRYMPRTFYAYLAAAAAISGLPLASGFLSKDEILFRSCTNHVVPSHALKHMALSGAREKSLSDEARQAVVRSLEAPEWLGKVIFAIGIITAVLTALYMFRSVFLTFYGKFRGWHIVPGFEPSEKNEATSTDGPVPRESPWLMTVPFGVLAVGALGVGLLNAGSIGHWIGIPSVMDSWLTPVFEPAAALLRTVKTGAMLNALAYTLLAASAMAFLVGGGAAWWIYRVRKGQPADKVAQAVPGLYQLVRDKWRVDELYDKTVIAMAEAFAETAVTFEAWVVDGILAKVTSAVVALAGAVLRLFQTGKVQMYAATMVVGLVAMGAFFALPHSDVVVAVDEKTGGYVLLATPGLGYRYRWDLDGDGTWDDGEVWSLRRSADLKGSSAPEPGETKKIRVQVRNCFMLTSLRELTLRRPKVDRSSPEPRLDSRGTKP